MAINLFAASTHLVTMNDFSNLTFVRPKFWTCVDILLEKLFLIEVYLGVAHSIEGMLVRIDSFAASYTHRLELLVKF